MPVCRRGCKSNRRQAFHFEVDLSRARERVGAKRTKRREFRATPPEARVREISRRVTSNATTFRNVQQVDSERTMREREKAVAAKCEVYTSSVQWW